MLLPHKVCRSFEDLFNFLRRFLGSDGDGIATWKDKSEYNKWSLGGGGGVIDNLPNYYFAKGRLLVLLVWWRGFNFLPSLEIWLVGRNQDSGTRFIREAGVFSVTKKVGQRRRII